MGEDRWHQCPGVGAADSGDRVVVLDLDATDPSPHVLEGLAAAIWRSLAVPITQRELVLGLVGMYDATYDRISTDVETFLNQLAETNVACTREHEPQPAAP